MTPSTITTAQSTKASTHSGYSSEPNTRSKLTDVAAGSLTVKSNFSVVASYDWVWNTVLTTASMSASPLAQPLVPLLSEPYQVSVLLLPGVAPEVSSTPAPMPRPAPVLAS